MEEHLADRIKHLTDECGLINEFKLAYSVREEMPLHYALAKALAPGARGERGGDDPTAGDSGKLSEHPNARGDLGFLERCTRINKNRAVYDPSARRWCSRPTRPSTASCPPSATT